MTQTCMMFLSELLCLLLLVIHKRRNRRQYLLRQDYSRMTGKVEPKLYNYLVPSLFDFLAAGCLYTALNFISGSTYQFIRCGTIVTTGIFSYCLTKVKFKRNQCIGAALSFFALIVAALSEYLQQRLEERYTDQQP